MEPMPPKDPPVGDVGNVASVPAAAAITKRPWWLAVVWWGLGGILALFLLAVVLTPTGHGHGSRALRVTARLVASDTGDPIEGARVLPLSSYDLDHDWEPEEAWETALFLNPSLAHGRAADEEQDRASEDDRWDCVGTRSGPGGRVEIVVDLWTSCRTHLLWTSHSAQEPQAGMAALWIAPVGGEPVVIHIEEVDWRPNEQDASFPIWGTYDLGTIVVPVGETSPR